MRYFLLSQYIQNKQDVKTATVNDLRLFAGTKTGDYDKITEARAEITK